MENDEAFEADAEIEALSRIRSSASHQSWRKGREVMHATIGRSKPQKHEEHEETPLLSREQGPEQSGPDRGPYTSDAGSSPPEWFGAHDYDGLPWWKTPSIYWLLPAFLLFTIAYGGTLVPKLNLILSLICREYCQERELIDPAFHMLPIMKGGDNPQCQIPEIQSLVSKFMLYASVIGGILSAIVSPKIGALSDRYGRIRMICLSAIGLLISEVITIVVATNSDMLSVYWILLGYAIDGLGGTFIAAMALSYAYASDCTIPDKRNVAFGYYHGCLFLGIALGPLFAAYIIKATGNILSIFYIAIGAHVLYLLWLLFVVPESLTKERQQIARKKFTDADSDMGMDESHAQELLTTSFSSIQHFFKSVNFLAPLSILWPTKPGTNPALRRNLFFLAAVDATIFGVAMGSLTVVLIYSEYMFGWGNFETSLFVSTVNICRVTVLVVLLPLASRLLRGPSSKAVTRNSGCDEIDLGIIRLAILFDLLGYIGYATVREGSLFVLSGVIASVGGMGSPTLSAALTKHVPPEKTGQVLGAVGLLHASGRIVAPAIFNLIYAKTVGNFTQTVFVCLAATFGLAFIFSLFIRPHVYWDQPNNPAGNEETLPNEDNNAENEDEPLLR